MSTVLLAQDINIAKSATSKTVCGWTTVEVRNLFVHIGLPEHPFLLWGKASALPSQA